MKFDQLKDDAFQSLFQAMLEEYENRSIKEVEEEVSIDHISKFELEAKTIAENPYKLRGIATGYPTLDKFLCGMDKGELIILAGETSVGKSLMACNLVRQAYQSGGLFSTLVFSLEMPRPNFISRFYMMDAEASAYPIYFYDNTKGATVNQVKRAMQKCKEEHGLDFVVIDHLHYFPVSINNTTNEIGKITRQIKQLAIEFNIPILLLSHVRRKAAGSADRRPKIDDLKDSSSIGQDADIVIMVDRNNEDESSRNTMNVYVDKNRNKGRTGNLDMWINFRTLEMSEE